MPVPSVSGGASVVVVIVNFNSGAYLARALEFLERQSLHGFRTVVVDNASTDASLSGLAERFPRVTFVQAGENLGFAAGNNLALRHAGEAEWVVLLNPDAFPAPDWLERLLAAARGHPGFDFFGCRMRLAGDTALLDGTGDVYHLSGASWRRDYRRPVGQGRQVEDEIFGPCAAAAMYRRTILDEVGGFDASYFCYHEDVDLAFRLRLKGYRCLYVPDAIVDHVSSGITGLRSDFSTYYGHRNLVWTFVKNMPGTLLVLFTPLHLAFTVLSLLICAARGQLRVVLRAKRDALREMRAVWGCRRRIQAGRRVSATKLMRHLSWGLLRR